MIDIKNWTADVRLGDLIKIEHGYAFKGKNMVTDVDSSLPIVVNIVNFNYSGGFRFDRSKIQRLIGDYQENYRLKPQEILLIMTCQTPGGEILGVHHQ